MMSTAAAIDVGAVSLPELEQLLAPQLLVDLPGQAVSLVDHRLGPRALHPASGALIARRRAARKGGTARSPTNPDAACWWSVSGFFAASAVTRRASRGTGDRSAIGLTVLVKTRRRFHLASPVTCNSPDAMSVIWCVAIICAILGSSIRVYRSRHRLRPGRIDGALFHCGLTLRYGRRAAAQRICALGLGPYWAAFTTPAAQVRQ